MTQIFSTPNVLLGLAVCWSVALYFYWRALRELHPNSRYRAYDVLFLTLIMGVLVMRVVELVANYNYYFRVVGGLQFLYFWDLDINYFALVFIPLLAYQFESFNIERNLKWKVAAPRFVAFGAMLVMLIEVAQLIRGLSEMWPQNLVVYHAALALLLAVVTGLGMLSAKRKALLPTHFILVIMSVGIVAINVIIPALSVVELNATIVSQIILCAVALVPFVSKSAKRTQISRPNPGDFRNL